MPGVKTAVGIKHSFEVFIREVAIVNDFELFETMQH